MSQKAQLYILEGPDCSGKTTAIGLLRKICEEKGKKVINVGVLDSTNIGKDVRKIVTRSDIELHSETVIALLLDAHEAAIHYILEKTLEIPEDQLNQCVFIVDRFLLSTLAYQGKQDNDIQAIHNGFTKRKILTKLFHYDPCFFLLSARDEILNERLAKKMDKDLFELKDNSFHASIRNYYQMVAPTKLSTIYKAKYCHIYTDVSIEETENQFRNIIDLQ